MRNRKPFCIWKRYNIDMGGFYYHSDCGKNYGDDEFDLNILYKFCPWCGGKIITEDEYNEVISEKS